MSRKILVVDDEPNMVEVVRMILEGMGHEVLRAYSAEQGIQFAGDPDLDVILTDLRMPGMSGEAFIAHCRSERPNIPVIIMTAHGTIKSAVECIKAGAADYLTKPFEPEEIEIVVHNALKLRDILNENRALKATVQAQSAKHTLIGVSAPFRQMLEEIRRVARHKSTVLIAGESGTGKELAARTIHVWSPRKDGPWVAINCAAIPRDLLESELFGHAKGAFTGATQSRPGRLEQAEGGTLFLDEIGEMDPSLQAKLLRVIEGHDFSPLGSNQTRKTDIRLIAATNRDLEDSVRRGAFREDLYYRLNVYRLTIPPLRERPEDIPVLATSFLQELTVEMDSRVSGFGAGAMDVLTRHAWPGNVRELRNTVERALLSCAGSEISVSDLPAEVISGRPRPAPPLPMEPVPDSGINLDRWIEETERRAILTALKEASGVQARAAKRLGINQRSLWYRVKRLGIKIDRKAS
ncbi:MAG: sigma-54 dependent transcriptional regulator [Nitrospirota bacterium]